MNPCHPAPYRNRRFEYLPPQAAGIEERSPVPVLPRSDFIT